MKGPCLCGDPECWICGGAMGTYSGKDIPDPPELRCEACDKLLGIEDDAYLCKECEDEAKRIIHSQPR